MLSRWHLMVGFRQVNDVQRHLGPDKNARDDVEAAKDLAPSCEGRNA